MSCLRRQLTGSGTLSPRQHALVGSEEAHLSGASARKRVAQEHRHRRRPRVSNAQSI